MRRSGIEICEFAPRFARSTVRTWRASKQKALGRPGIHSFTDDVDFLINKLARTDRIFLAFDRAKRNVVGLMAINGNELDQLYVHPRYQRRGIGTAMLALAKELSPSGLRLFTFEMNSPARRFYEKHGFIEAGRGFPNEEMLPDIRYEWKGID